MYQAKRTVLQMLSRNQISHFFFCCPTGKQIAHTDTICTHTAVSRSHTKTAINLRYTHTAVNQSYTHTAVSQSHSHTTVTQRYTYTVASQQLYNLHNMAISSSFSRAYKSGLHCFRQFCKHLKLNALPASKHMVALFTEDSSRSVAPRIARV